MNQPLRVLIIEDSEDDALLLLRELRKGGYAPQFERVETREAMMTALKQREWDLVISDYVLPCFSGPDALATLAKSGVDLPFIIVSGNIGEDIAVNAMKAGANDYLIKGNLTRLAPAVERELREAKGRRARKQAEEERDLLVAAVTASADAVMVTDAKGYIQYVNPAFEHMTGYSKAEAIGRTIHLLDSGRYDEAFFQKIRDALSKQGVWYGRLFNKKKDGTLYLEDCAYSSVRDQQGSVLYHVSVRRDVTDKVRLESIAESVNMMDNIGYIFSGVRHEIGNPINAINLNLSILKQKLDTLDKPAIEKYIDRALHEVSEIEYLMLSLKNFNIFEKPSMQKIPIRSFFDKFLSLAGKDFQAKGIEIGTQISTDAQECMADPRALQQVLLNLLTNAADALQGRHKPRVSIVAANLNGRVRIRMEDNGIGIPDAKLKDLFKPFYTTKVHGTGLGLVIVKKLLAQMHGTIEITSRKNAGTTVDIFLQKACIQQPETAEGTHHSA